MTAGPKAQGRVSTEGSVFLEKLCAQEIGKWHSPGLQESGHNGEAGAALPRGVCRQVRPHFSPSPALFFHAAWDALLPCIAYLLVLCSSAYCMALPPLQEDFCPRFVEDRPELSVVTGIHLGFPKPSLPALGGWSDVIGGLAFLPSMLCSLQLHGALFWP